MERPEPSPSARQRSRSARAPGAAGGRVRLLLVLLALAATLDACRSRVSFRSPTPTLVSSSAPLPVTLSPELLRLRAHDSTIGAKTTYKVGNLLQPLFVSKDGRAFLSLVAADIRTDWSAASWEARYSLTVLLQWDGTSRRIEAVGRGTSEDSPSLAGQAAVEDCVEDAYEQIAAVLERPPR
jgi:hypothetical protein